MYDDYDFLMLSGLQHYAFCKRQWSLIHLEKQWEQNLFTVQGDNFHERAHDEALREKRGNILTVRGLKIKSHVLGITGACDIVEFHQAKKGIRLYKYEGLWDIVPIEYKKGQSKISDVDRLQLCAQAMCLEEMMCHTVTDAYLFYGEMHSREKVELTTQLREQVVKLTAEMHTLYRKRHTPKVKPTKACPSCSLKDLCLPKLSKNLSAKKYIQQYLEED
ncbi:MAG: CRISPR-associated protein Cas4 [Epulopiscium sp. Nele67-Bin001]|nr:MAG: CRISPR-associated protein Cas4 [Epulopiscium sp. Nele67-Bin001]